MMNFFKKLPAHEKKITLSTMLTLFRIALVPCIVSAMIMGMWGVACILFCGAAISDVLDGYLARLFHEQTFLGACLDPIADKLLVVSCFFTLACIQSPVFAIPQWFVIFVLIKELILIGGSIAFYLFKGYVDIRPTLLGKTTAVVQMSFIIWLFACYFFNWMPIKTYISMLGIMLFLVFASLVQYCTIGVRQLQ